MKIISEKWCCELLKNYGRNMITLFSSTFEECENVIKIICYNSSYKRLYCYKRIEAAKR